jgi:hypothetical protein
MILEARQVPAEKGNAGVFFGGAASKPPLGGAATQTRESLGYVFNRAQRIHFHRWDLMRCARLKHTIF